VEEQVHLPRFFPLLHFSPISSRLLGGRHLLGARNMEQPTGEQLSLSPLATLQALVSPGAHVAPPHFYASSARRACTCLRLEAHFTALEAQISALGALQPSPSSDGPISLSSSLSAALNPPWSTILGVLEHHFGDIYSIKVDKSSLDTLRLLVVWLKETMIAEDEVNQLRSWLSALKDAANDFL